MAVLLDASPPVPSDTERHVQTLIGRFIDTVFHVDPLSWLGIAALAFMVIFYGLESRSRLFSIAFAMSCVMAATYGYLRGSWPIVAVGAIWGALALVKFWRHAKVRGSGLSMPEHLALAWLVRSIGIVAVAAGVVVLLVDSPVMFNVPIRIDHTVAEAIPLLLVGIAYLAWLATERPAILDLIKQFFISLAFILWGADLLMPAGKWARFVGAVVISIYVFDLAWLIEGNLRSRLRSHRSEASTVGHVAAPPANGDERTRFKLPTKN